MYIFCEETVKRWMDEFKSEGRDINEEIKDTKVDIENNKLWKKGSLTKKGASCHEQNIADLTEYLARLEELAKEIKKPYRKPRNKKGNNSSSSNPFNQHINSSIFDNESYEEYRKSLFQNNPFMHYGPFNNPFQPLILEIYGITIDSAGRLYLEVTTDIGKYHILPLITNQDITLTEFVSDVDEEFLPHLYKLNWDNNEYLFKCKEGLNEKILGLVLKDINIDLQTKIYGKEDIILGRILNCLMKYKRIIELPLKVESVNIESKVDEYGSSTEFSFNKKYEESYLYKLDHAKEYK